MKWEPGGPILLHERDETFVDQMTEIYDIIVVGGGLGGLAAASFSAKAGRSVLVLERHKIPGGFCTDYYRGKYHFDSAVHYLGTPSIFREIFSALGVEDMVKVVPMDPKGFDVYRFPDLEFRVPATPDALKQRLLEHFPREKKGIEKYIKTLKNFVSLSEHIRYGRTAGFYLGFPFKYTKLLTYMKASLKEYLVKLTSDIRLRAVLGAQWGIHGETPSRVPLFVSLGGTSHYHEGGWYPRGGTGKISKALAAAVANFGGVIRTKCEVVKVLTENGHATGVELADGETIMGKSVVMAGDLWDGFQRLLARAPVNKKLVEIVKRTEPSASMIHLHVGLSSVPDSWKWNSCNIWSYPTYDFDEIDRDMKREILPEKLSTFTSVSYRKNPECDPDGTGKCMPSVTILGIVHYKHFKPFMSMVGNRRTEEYKKLKKRIEKRLLMEAEEMFPGITERAKYIEVATPFTQYRYTLNKFGGSYGFARTTDNWFVGKPPWCHPLKNVWWTGANAGFHGVMGAIQAGIETASDVTGEGIRKLLIPSKV